MHVSLRLTQTDHAALNHQLFPGDGLEAIAVALCGRRRSRTRHALTVRRVVPIPYDECKVRRPTESPGLRCGSCPLLEEPGRRDLAILRITLIRAATRAILIPVDDQPDADLFNSVFGWTDSRFPHARAVLPPHGNMFGRATMRDGSFQPLDSNLIPGDDLQFWIADGEERFAAFAQRHAQLVGACTINRLRRMAAAIGCSGTAAP
jgi:hypothetical protein